MKKSNKVKKFFSEIFLNRKTKLAFFTCVLSFLLLVGVTFAWFYSIIELPQSEIKTGSIDYVVKGYDDEGNFISTILNPDDVTEDTVNPNHPLFDLKDISANLYTTAYISIENAGSLDMEYSFALKVNGLDEDVKNVGGFWFKIEEITSIEYQGTLAANKESMGDEYDARLFDYSVPLKTYTNSASEIIPCTQECIDNGSNMCTEHSTLSRNLITANSYAVYGKLDGEKKVAFYRIDIGLKATSTPERYANTSLRISGEVYGTQIGGIKGETGYGNIYKVSDAQSLDKAIENALPGDSIQLIAPIVYHGDLVFNKSISLITYGNDLTIYGNLVYDFVASYTLKLNLTHGGQIKVLKENGAGGDLQISTPNSTVLVTGKNYTSNIYVEDIATFKVTNSDSSAGMFISGANFLSKEGNPKNIQIDSNSKITLDYDAALGLIEAVPNASNVKIINYGTIKTINLSRLLIVDLYPEAGNLVDTGAPQILIDNYYRIIDPIQLPALSSPYVLEPNENGEHEGNTLVYRQVGADEMSVHEDICPFKNVHIIDYNKTGACVMQKVTGKNDKLIVYYGNRLDENGNVIYLTIQDLLEEYFMEYHGLQTSDEARQYIDLVNHIEVFSLTDVEFDDGTVKKLTKDDLSYMNGMDRLNSIDISKATVENNTIPSSAFKDNKVLTSFILPNNIERIEGSAFNGSGLQQIRFPSTVNYYVHSAIYTIKYVFFDSATPVTPTNSQWAALQNHYIFCNEAYLSEYITAFKSIIGSTRIFVDGVVTDDGLHVVRDGMEGYELIVYTGTGGELKIGSELSLNGESISITTIKRYAYSSVKENFNAEFEATVTQIEDYAFTSALVENIKFNNVRTIGKYAFQASLLSNIDFGNVTTVYDYAFYKCEQLSEVDTKNIEYIGYAAFNSCINIYKVNCPNVLTLESYAFTGCSRLLTISFEKLKTCKFDFNCSQLVNIYFKNENFDNCTFTTLNANKQIATFRVYVTATELAAFNKLKFCSSTIVYPIGDIVGTYEITGTTTFGLDYGINIGEYLVSTEEDNVTLLNCNIPVISEDYTVPSKVTVEYEDRPSVEKTVVTVGSYCYRSTKFEDITLTFGESITTVETWAFYGHASAYYYVYDFRAPIEVVNYYNHINEIVFNNVKYIGNYSFYFFKNIKEIKNNVIEEIGLGAFKSCENLFTVDLPKIRTIGVEGQTYNHIFGMDKELVSIKLGPNLEKIYGNYLVDHYSKKFKELIIEAEITKDDYNDYLFYNNYYANYNKDFRIFVPESVISNQRATYDRNIRIIGEKYGERLVTHSNGVDTFNIGEFTYKPSIVNDVNGVSITSFNNEKVTYELEIPEIINDVKVIKFDYNCFRDIVFKDAPTINDSGEHIKIFDTILEFSDYAFYNTDVRFSKLPNVIVLGNCSIHTCSNIYYIDAPELLTAGNSVFATCANIKIVYAPKLHTVGTWFLSATTPIALYTDIQTSGNNTWLNTSSIKYITFATTPNSKLELKSGVIPDNMPRAALCNDDFASGYVSSDSYSYGIFSQDKFKLVEPYDYNILDENGNTIYSTTLYEYLVNKEGEYVTIYRYLNTEITEDYYVPGVLDDRTVTAIGDRAFTSVNFNYNEVSFSDTITKIGVAAFKNCKIGGTLDLNNVYSISVSTFESNSFEVLHAPNLTAWHTNCFASNDSLISVYLHKIKGYSNSPFQGSDNMKYYYTETMPNFGVDHAFYVKDGMTFVINVEVDDANDIVTTRWNLFSNVTMFVPYASLEIYESVFETENYNNFAVEPYGYVLNETETGNVFIFEEVKGNLVFNEETQTMEYEKVLKLKTCLCNNESVVIPDMFEGLKVTLIDEKAFEGQVAIKHIVLPIYLYSYDENTFQNVTNLASLEIDNENSEHFSTHNGVLYTKGYIDLVHYPKCKQDKSYPIHENTKVIRSNAFKNVLVLNSLTISTNIEVIGENAFINSSIKIFIFDSTTPPVVTGHNIFNQNNSSLIIYVPQGSIDNYRKVNAFAYMNLVEL